MAVRRTATVFTRGATTARVEEMKLMASAYMAAEGHGVMGGVMVNCVSTQDRILGR